MTQSVYSGIVTQSGRRESRAFERTRFRLKDCRNDRKGMKNIILAIIISLAVSSYAFAAEVKNVVSSQAGNRVLFEYDLTGEEKEADVNIMITVNGTTYSADKLHLEGDYGKVKTGKGRKIYWNVLQDFPRGLNTTFDWEITAGGKEFKDPVTGMEFVFVKGGCFQMGCGDWTSDCDSDEKPVHEVCVDDFYMGKYEVTQGQWREVIGNNPSYFMDCGDNCPVEQVSWEDVQNYIRKLTQKAGKNYRLPTEAEWEYAARSCGKREKWAGTNSESDIGDYAWYQDIKSHRVGQKRSNDLGFFDMSGNVSEWVHDSYHENYYKYSIMDNPNGPGNDWTHITYRGHRGGSWLNGPKNIRTTDRGGDGPGYRVLNLGFRLLMIP